MIVRCFLYALISNNLVELLKGLEDPASESRIVGGTSTTIEQYPYQISLQREGGHICGGSIITDSWILTAGHCVDGSTSEPSLYTVRTGSSYFDHGGKLNAVKSIVIHENFNATAIDHDIAAVQLETPLVFTSTTFPIPVAKKTDIFFSGVLVTVTGWGKLSQFGNGSKILQKVEIPLVSWKECAKAYEEHPITERMICAGVLNAGGKDACQGDSGGPLALNGKLIGIVSWGFGCAHPSYPGVYTRVTAFREWIETKTRLRVLPPPPVLLVNSIANSSAQ
ncbi:trypsin 3A1-like [Athalia rosae]|uniref:trypsin 3A1-like n=1 Tax=Athalia rosae TaxID=37344 RepID=UPI002033F4DC|nr:trypsin 3A1-like [Athalia rosae]